MPRTPYSDRIIFLDTEFTYLNARKTELLSIGLVKFTGEELYVELEHTDDMDPWVKEKVLPYLTGHAISKEEARQKITAFIGEEKPYLMAYVNQFDAVLWYDLFGSAQEHPAYWIPIDFASILFAYGYTPNSMGKHDFFKEPEIDMQDYEGRAHNALGDAQLLAQVYKKIIARTA